MGVIVKENMNKCYVGLFLIFFFFLVGCSFNDPSSSELVVKEMEVLHKVPPGVVRYCWEEPVVDYERVNPGLGEDGKWYYPAYLAVKEVRAGRWVPCRDIKSRTYGRYDDK